jgi:hypothetical protein
MLSQKYFQRLRRPFQAVDHCHTTKTQARRIVEGRRRSLDVSVRP